MLHITEHMPVKGSGWNKMEGFYSINTSSLNNPFCQTMRQTKGVCFYCYWKTSEKIRMYMMRNFEHNSSELTKKSFKAEKLDDSFNGKYIRLNCAGELLNEQHYLNFLKICKVNPEINFALWSKRKNIIQNVHKSIIKPANLILVYSSWNIDIEEKLPEMFNKVFTVYSEKFLQENNIDVNCLKYCKKCMKCYENNETVYIREKIKRSVGLFKG